MRVRFVVFEKHVEARLVFLDEVRLEYQSLDLVIDDDELKIGDEFHELPRFGVVTAARVKVRPHAVSQVFRLTDIDDLSGSVLMNVNAGVGR